jgi:hypothetical protein
MTNTMQKLTTNNKIWIGLGIILLAIYGIVNSETSNEQAETQLANQMKTDTPILNLEELNYNLPQSNYTYKVKITAIRTKIKKNAYSTKTDEYAIPQSVDGYYLTIDFSIRNPYDKEMLAPIPEYFYIASPKKEFFTASTTYSKRCSCDLDNGTKLTTDKGKELWEINDGRCGNNNYCIKFKPNEVKNFSLRFDDPIIITVKELIFCGFDLKWEDKNTGYKYTNERDLGILINTETKELVKEVKL